LPEGNFERGRKLSDSNAHSTDSKIEKSGIDI